MLLHSIFKVKYDESTIALNIDSFQACRIYSMSALLSYLVFFEK